MYGCTDARAAAPCCAQLDFNEMVQLQAAGKDGKANNMLIDVKKGKKTLASAYMKGSKSKGIDLSGVAPDVPTPITAVLMEEGKKGLKQVGEITIEVNFALIDQ